MAPGPTELTRMPCGPSASARAFGHQHHAALAGGEAHGESGTSDAAHAGISTMLPGLPWAFIASAAAYALNNTPFRFTATSRLKSASVTSARPGVR